MRRQLGVAILLDRIHRAAVSDEDGGQTIAQDVTTFA